MELAAPPARRTRSGRLSPAGRSIRSVLEEFDADLVSSDRQPPARSSAPAPAPSPSGLERWSAEDVAGWLRSLAVPGAATVAAHLLRNGVDGALLASGAVELSDDTLRFAFGLADAAQVMVLRLREENII